MGAEEAEAVVIQVVVEEAVVVEADEEEVLVDNLVNVPTSPSIAGRMVHVDTPAGFVKIHNLATNTKPHLRTNSMALHIIALVDSLGAVDVR